MRISRIRISNYRSLSDIEVSFQSLVALIGENNSGKSNILSALSLFFSASKKDLNEYCFAFRDCKKKISIEVTFVNLNALETAEFTKGGWILPDGSVCIRREFYCDEEEEYQVDIFGLKEEPVEPYLKEDEIKTYANEETVQKYGLPQYFVAPSGKVTQGSYKDGVRKYVSENRENLTFEQYWKRNPRGLKEVVIGFLPTYLFVPAVRDVSDEEKLTTTTLFGKLMNAVIERILEENEQVVNINKHVRALTESLNDPDSGLEEVRELEQELTTTLSECMTDTTVSLEISPPDLGRIFQIGTRIVVDDGLKTYLEDKGHGLQRTMLFSLFRCYSRLLQDKIEQPEGMDPDEARISLIFAVEEPELFLHPQLQRKMLEILRMISERDQVLFCTHSPCFVNLDDYKSVTILSKPSRRGGSIVSQYTEEIFSDEQDKYNFKLLNEFDPERSEMFFAKKVVLVEGDSEKVSIPLMAESLDVHSHDVTIVECGGKHNLPFFIKVLSAFDMPFNVIHDEDPIPPGLDPTSDTYRGKKKTFELNAIIKGLVNDSEKQFILTPKFEEVANIPKTQAENLGKPFAAFLHFKDRGIDDIPLVLREVVQKVYRTEEVSR